MPIRQRDYATEYRARVERAKGRGYVSYYEERKAKTVASIEGKTPEAKGTTYADRQGLARAKGYENEYQRQKKSNQIRDRLETYDIDRNSPEHREMKKVLREAMDELTKKKKEGVDAHLSDETKATLRKVMQKHLMPGQVWGMFRELY